MKSIKRTIRDSRLKTHQAVSGWLRPRLGAVGLRWRLPARIRLVNRWATRHPKKTFCYVTGALLMILVADFALTGAMDEKNNPDMEHIANVEPMFRGFRTIQANKDEHRKTVLELAGQGQAIRQELDSMIRIPAKTRDDSISIMRKYGQLEQIVKSLKQNDND